MLSWQWHDLESNRTALGCWKESYCLSIPAFFFTHNRPRWSDHSTSKQDQQTTLVHLIFSNGGSVCIKSCIYSTWTLAKIGPNACHHCKLGSACASSSSLLPCVASSSFILEYEQWQWHPNNKALSNQSNGCFGMPTPQIIHHNYQRPLATRQSTSRFRMRGL